MADPLRGRRAVTIASALGAALTAAYWVIWYGVSREWLASAHTPAYYAFENAFPLADAWLTFALGAAAVALWRRHASALLWLMAAGSAAIYLGSMDVLFDLENGIYLAPTGDWGAVAVEIAINLLCLVGGAFALRYAWVQRLALMG